jgi:hypothetical protein
LAPAQGSSCQAASKRKNWVGLARMLVLPLPRCFRPRQMRRERTVYRLQLLATSRRLRVTQQVHQCLCVQSRLPVRPSTAASSGKPRLCCFLVQPMQLAVPSPARLLDGSTQPEFESFIGLRVSSSPLYDSRMIIQIPSLMTVCSAIGNDCCLSRNDA